MHDDTQILPDVDSPLAIGSMFTGCIGSMTGSTARGAIALKMGDSGVQSSPRRRSLIPRGMAPSLLLLLVGCPCLMVLHEMTPYRIEERAGSWTANLMQISTLLRSERGIRDSKASRYQVGVKFITFRNSVLYLTVLNIWSLVSFVDAKTQVVQNAKRSESLQWSGPWRHDFNGVSWLTSEIVWERGARWILKVVWKLSCTQELQIKTSSASIEPHIGSTIQSLRLKIVLVILLVLFPSDRTHPKLLTEPANKKKTTSKCRIVCQTHLFEVPPCSMYILRSY
jgi:hypothetical protein